MSLVTEQLRGPGATGSVEEFDDNWKIRTHEARQNYYTSGIPVNQIMMSFKNQWEVYRLFIGDIRPGMKMLEPGCGRGSISCYFAANGFEAHVLDTSQEILDVAKDIFRENKLHAEYHCEDALNMSFADETFDVIVHCGLLEHFENYEAAIAEQYRVLKRGGIIIANIVPGKRSVQTAFGFVNRALKTGYALLVRFGGAGAPIKHRKHAVYRSPHGSGPYVAAFEGLGARIEYRDGIFPVPSFSYSPEFPFTVMSAPVERLLVWCWSRVLDVRKFFWPDRHPWMASERWGQHVLVIARKPVQSISK